MNTPEGGWTPGQLVGPIRPITRQLEDRAASIRVSASFSDAEAAEDLVQDILGVNGPDDFSHMGQGQA